MDSQYIVACSDGEVLEFGHLIEARNYAADLAAEGIAASLYTRINVFEAAPCADQCTYNGVAQGQDFPATLHA